MKPPMLSFFPDNKKSNYIKCAIYTSFDGPVIELGFLYWEDCLKKESKDWWVAIVTNHASNYPFTFVNRSKYFTSKGSWDTFEFNRPLWRKNIEVICCEKNSQIRKGSSKLSILNGTQKKINDILDMFIWRETDDKNRSRSVALHWRHLDLCDLCFCHAD